MVKRSRVVVDGEAFDVTERGNSSDFTWSSGPSAGYGFTIGRTDRGALSERDIRDAIRQFLAAIDPATGYLAE